MAAQIDITQEPSRYNPAVTVLRLGGTIDATTADELKNSIEHQFAANHQQLLLDMRAVDYISSAGIGTIISMLKKIRDLGLGDIKICHTSDSIYRILESVGLHLIMEIYQDEAHVAHWISQKLDKPFDHFTFLLLNEPICGQPFKARISARTQDQKIARNYGGAPKLSVNKGLILPPQLTEFENGEWEGLLTTIDSGMLTLTISDGKIANDFVIQVDERKPEGKHRFPVTIACPDCQKKAHVKGVNIYQCKQCQSIFYVDAWAQVIILKKGNLIHKKKHRLKGSEIKISSNVNYLAALRQFIAALAETENIDTVIIQDLMLVTEEVVMNIIEHAYDFDPHQIIVVRLHFRSDRVLLHIFDYGQAFDITKQKGSVYNSLVKGRDGGVGSILINQLMDEVNYISNGKINQLAMTRLLKSA